MFQQFKQFRSSRNCLILAGVILLASWIPLVRYPSLSGEGVVPFLGSFCSAGLAYLLALSRLDREEPTLALIWIFAVLFRLVLLMTPVTLSDDVYRYLWDGHLMRQGINPYAEVANSPMLDEYATPLRDRVNYSWLATPYLPAAQFYFALINWIAPQSTKAFQIGAALLDLGAGFLVMMSLPMLGIPKKAVLVYLWNPMVVVEFAHGAHVDAMMVFFVVAGLWGFLVASRTSLLASVLAWAAAVLVKGWPVLAAPLFIFRWGLKRTILFGISIFISLTLFAVNAGWGLYGEADGRGLFGTIRVYLSTWSFNSGLYFWIEKLIGTCAAGLISLITPAMAGLLLGCKTANAKAKNVRSVDWNRTVLRWAALPFWLFFLLANTIHPWYLTLLIAWLPFFWPSGTDDRAIKKWIWPWIYFMFLEAFTYLSYAGFDAPNGLDLIRTVAYLPFWGLLIWAGWHKGLQALAFSRVPTIIMKNRSI